MKLYFSPGACSLCPHIVLHEAGLAHESVKVDLKTHQLPDGSDYYAINPRGYVPLLELDSGERLTENAALVQYIADLAPGSGLLPPAGTLERTRVQSWLAFIGSELHKSFSPLFNPAMPDEAKSLFKKKLVERFGWVDGQLAGKSWLMGESFSVADAYLFVMTGWAARTAPGHRRPGERRRPPLAHAEAPGGAGGAGGGGGGGGLIRPSWSSARLRRPTWPWRRCRPACRRRRPAGP